MSFHVGVVQNSPAYLKSAANIRAALDLMKGKKADLWVLPEFFNSGYNFRSKKEAASCAETADGPLAAALRGYSLEHDCAIVAGFPERSGTTLYNSALFVNGKRTRVYRKTHLFGGEKKFFQPGDTGFWTADVKGVKVGVMICFDWFFPESARTLALKGAQVIAHPANLVLPWCPEGMKIRCLENRVFAATADRVGVEHGLGFIGQSQVVSPKGVPFFRLGGTKPGARVATIDPALALDKKVHPACDLFQDRRRRHYAL